MSDELIIIGGGLAGSEAAWQAAKRGVKVRLYEMRPEKMTEAHATSSLGELVCSNSLRSNDPHSAPGLLKAELSLAGSLIMEAAEATTVPAGSALAVDRTLFGEYITKKLSEDPHITIIREEVRTLPDTIAVIATGPLTSQSMTDALSGLAGEEYLYFYDAIAPIIDADSIDRNKVYAMSRYGKGGNDYLNCPMSKDEYEQFYQQILAAEKVNPKGFEEKKVFEGCMPIEVMAARGVDTMRYGPMKPVGLPDPRTGKDPYAVVQLRTENREMTAYNMVGFQTRLTWPEQKRVFSLIPGLEHADFLRYGSIHRNTFINAPALLNKDLSFKQRPHLFLAGQITGVEGYIESTAMGLIAGVNAALRIQGKTVPEVPPLSAHGALIRHITEAEGKHFQPSNINFGLFPVPEGLGRMRDKKLKRARTAELALEAWKEYCLQVHAA
ncbi:MAG: methylenetetrahydrofolate--tRNA-(uracil(54)-C(5))-methyltransferase (FADH(2)-oxidizing) TrmFO [Nitrospirae bacterium]|nr:methylenetetrahydrofolate--tRNA-(uracil(54)-C(5))-methyltransferase (FADH(2)-oxidizing) TrmFO [Nitrospirota bacterium]